jgi:hypothetical protein
MALFKPLRGNRSTLDAQALHDGYAYFCTDDGSFHIDYVDADGNLQRKQINETDINNMNDKITALETQMADILYEEIAISSFTNNIGAVEIGSTINTVTLSWKTNKMPTTLMINGESVDVSTTSYIDSDLSLTTGKTYTLTATDDRNATVSKTTSISFVNGVYYGVLDGGVTINNDAILSLTRKLQNKKSITFTVTAGSGQYIYYILPTNYGTPTMTVNGFSGGFDLVQTFDFTNASSYTTSYDVWRSTNDNLGETTVVIS